LPSSLTRVLSRALGFSPRLPVSVCGTGTACLARGFSRQLGISHFGTLFSLALASQDYQSRGFASRFSLPAWTGSSCRPLCLPFCLPLRSNGMSAVSESPPIIHHLRSSPRLRSRLTLGGRTFPRKPQASGGQDSHLPSRLLIPAFSLLSAPALLSVCLLRP
jgi:hypothetical protein